MVTSIRRTRVPSSIATRSSSLLGSSQLWQHYAEAEFPHLQPKTQRNYIGHWRKWELFPERDFITEDVKLGDVDHFPAVLERPGDAVSQIHKAITTAKTVFASGQRREIVGTNRLGLWSRVS